MSGFNSAIIQGRLGQDPDIKYAANGTAVCNLSIATSETWKDKDTGEKQEKTEWHRVVMFGKQAEVAGEYLKKGTGVLINGKLQTRKWQDSNGQDRYTTEIVANPYGGLVFVERGAGGASSQQADQQASGFRDKPKPSQGQSDAFADDDIPF